MICQSCGTENRADRRFCRSCGVALGRVCPNCGAANDAEDRFCGQCGTTLDAGATETPGVPVGAGESAAGLPTERRLVSILFADLVGFTTLAEGRDPEAVRELLARYFELARERIERYGGSVEKFIGDAVMAVWGTPVAHEDDAERAVRAALELVDAVAGLNTAEGAGHRTEQLAARAGVLTGEAAVTVGRINQSMVAGDLVNTASRLQSLAEPGTVLVGEQTVRASESSIVYEPIGDRQLKGRSAPIAAWRAVRVVAGRRGFGRATRLEAPFVGRDTELRLLKDLFHATARDGRARLVSVTGIAGIGKSRLTWELEKYIDGLVENVYWHQGRSPAFGDGLAFWALGEMIRGRARIAESDDAPTTRSKLREALLEYVPEEADRTWIEPRLAALLGIEPMPPGGTEEVFASWRLLFERMADRGPTILVFEELHWADDALLDFVDSLLSHSRARPIFILTLARPELLERRPTWGAGQRSFTSLDLGPLAPDEMEMLLVGLVPGLPQPALLAIRDRAEGVPLYAVETVRMLLDQGRLTEADGRYRLAGELGPLAVPDSLSGLLGARLDALDEADRTLLGQAALLGQSFTVDALIAVAGVPEANARRSLDTLVRVELLRLEDDPRSPERGQYQFLQGLLREVSYARVSKRERLARHLAAADYFEGLGEPELAGVVASHRLAALQAAGEGQDTPTLAEQAMVALLRAADRAESLHARVRALGYLDDAAGIARNDAERALINERAADIAIEGPSLDRAEGYVERALEWALAQDDPDAVMRGRLRIGRVLLYRGQPEEARQSLAEAFDPDRSDPSPAWLALGAELARATMMSGDVEATIPIVERCLILAERLNDRAAIAELFATKGWAIAEAGRLQEGLALMRGALPFAERNGYTNAWFRLSMNLSGFAWADDPAEAFAVARRGHEVAVRLGVSFAVGLAGNASDVARDLGEWDWIERMSASLDPTQFGHIFRTGMILHEARICGLRGQAERARDLVQSARDLTVHDDPQIVANFAAAEATIAYGLHDDAAVVRFADSVRGITLADINSDTLILGGHAALWLGDSVKAAGFIDQLEMSALIAGRAFAASTLVVRAGIDAVEGRTARALERYDQAIATLREHGLIVGVARALIDRVHFLPNESDTVQKAEEAREILERLGANGLLTRLPPRPDDASGRDEERPAAAENVEQSAERVPSA